MMFRSVVLAAGLTLAGAAGAAAQQPDSGAAVYTRSCASCHGAKGTPSAAMAHMGAPDFAASTVVPDSVLREAVVNGKGRAMPAYKARLSAAQVEAVVAYIKSLRRP